MKLSNKILQYFAIAIIIVLLVTGISTSIAFRSALSSYLSANVEEEFNNKANELSSLYSVKNSINSSQLAQYAKNQKINIRLFDINKELVAEFYGINNVENNQNKLLSKNFDLEDVNGNKLGIIELSYLENLYLYNNSITMFYRSLTTTYAIIIVLAILSALLMMSYFSSKLVKPISEMNNFTQEIKKGNYTSIKDDYNIYEIDELSRNLNYLSNTLSLQENHRLSYAQDIAHELRTPLTNLLLHLEGIRDEIIQADPKTIELLISEVNRLNKMVNNLHLSFDKRNETGELKMENANISSILDQTISSFKPKLDEKNITLSKAYKENINLQIDIDKFSQVINNLISNAIKAVENNGQIKIKIDQYPNRTVLSIADNGIGISEKDIKHIFERFFRVDSARNRTTGGHGLGLAIVKSNIELMGGNITVNSKENRGTEFIITFKNEN